MKTKTESGLTTADQKFVDDIEKGKGPSTKEEQKIKNSARTKLRYQNRSADQKETDREKARIRYQNRSEEQKDKDNKAANIKYANRTDAQIKHDRGVDKAYREGLPQWKKDQNKQLLDIRKNIAQTFWFNYKMTEGCFHCLNESLKDLPFISGKHFESHHVHVGDKRLNRRGNTVDVSEMVLNGNRIEVIQEELTHCVTLCKRCHGMWHDKLLIIDFSKWINYDATKPLKI